MTAVQQWWRDSGRLRNYFREDFNNGLSLYTVTAGDQSKITLVADDYGDAIRFASVFNTVVRVQRTTPAVTMHRLKLRFRIDSKADDDCCVCNVRDASFNDLAIVTPYPLAFFDSLRRCRVTLGGESIVLGSAAVTTGVWYELTVNIVAGAGNSNASLVNLVSGLTVGTGTFSSAHSPAVIGNLNFQSDCTATTSTTLYDAIEIR